MVASHLRSSFGNRPALVSSDRSVITYSELVDQAEQFAHDLGSTRKLILVVGHNNASAIVAYLGSIIGGHVVLLVPGDAASSDSELARIYQPDVVVSRNGDGAHAAILREKSAHDLHPDLALCLSTSGSTGSPKLVRLSYDNVFSNAEAIATYLSITSDDRAITTLPMYYCSACRSSTATSCAVQPCC